MNYGWETAKILFYLLLVLGIIYLLAYLFKKNYNQFNGGNNIELLERIYLGPKASLNLIKVKDIIVLLSVAEEQSLIVHKWTAAEFGELKLDEGTDFKSYLQGLINRRDENE